MSHRLVLSLLCFSLLLLSVVRHTRAGGELRVNEGRTRVLFEKEVAEVFLALDNSSNQTLNVKVQLELLDPANSVASQLTQAHAIKAGDQLLRLSLPLSLSDLNDSDRRELLWYRLRYRVVAEGSPGHIVSEGTLSLSEVTPDRFEIRVATSELAREGGRYHARVHARHPITGRPAPNVSVDGEVTLQDDDKSVKLRASGTTDTEGYALLTFVLPPRFPQFPHTIQPAGGEIHIIAKRGGIVAEAQDDVVVDQFARTLITTDKPLYQPGQVMHVRALMFTPSQRALANQNILIRIHDPEDTTIFRTVVSSSRFGIVNADWTIPENARLGNYRIWVGVDGGEEDSDISYDVRISRYELPNFTVSVQPDRAYYLPRQSAEVKVRAEYLFGQPVLRGQVRVVRETSREWDYREQKWETEEEEEYKGETDAQGFFVAKIDLADHHDNLGDSGYSRFEDLTYTAYFTDPTTNRTEQRRFDLRVSKEAIHVYVINNDSDSSHNPALPLKFYVSTFYADGTPARCKVNVRLAKSDFKGRSVTTVRSNRYGLAKVSGVDLRREVDSNGTLLISAVDSKGRTGWTAEDLTLDDKRTVTVETDKTLYKRGEPISALITSSIPGQRVFVEVAGASSVIHSELIQLHHGRRSLVLPFNPDFKDKLTIVAYPDFADSRSAIAMRTILYPGNQDLAVDVQTSKTTYRPGEDLEAQLSVRAPDDRSPESALGVVVFDKAVEERVRTDQEFGHRNFYNASLQSFLGHDQKVAGVTVGELRRLDMSKPVSPELELVAEVLLSQTPRYDPRFFGSAPYETAETVFGPSLREQLKPIREALTAHYARTTEYPRDMATLERFLREYQIELNAVRDAWGTNYRTLFSVDKRDDDLTFVSAGADKRFETDDDIYVTRLSWPYFRPLGEAIDRAVRTYHEQTRGFIRDYSTLRAQLSKDGLGLDQIRDRWDQPYRFEFDVRENDYLIKIRSAGPDKQFSANAHYLDDDFIIWTSSIDYLVELRAELNAAMRRYLNLTKTFPQNDTDLEKALQALGHSLKTLRDVWNRPYYATFMTERSLASVYLQSLGPDGKAGTADDFTAAAFTGVITEESRERAANKTERRPFTSTVMFPTPVGAIQGVVTDSLGAVIPGTKVTVKRSADGPTFETETNEYGKYRFANLTSGVYEIRFDVPGFQTTIITDVLVRSFNITTVNTHLEVGTIAETVTVTGGGSRLNQAQTSISVNASRSTIPGKIKIVTKSGSSQDLSTPRLREYFPETLLWQPNIETDKQGRAQINFKLADNITTWKLAVIGSTEDGLIGTTEKEIRAFQPFFVEHDPPRVLTEGDEISLPVVLRNYLDRSQKVDLEITPGNWFALLGPARKQTTVNAGDATRETFDFRAVNSIADGKQRITATAGDANDAIEKPITVHPDGEERSLTAGDLLGDSATLEFNIPEAIIRNSERAELKVYPSLMAHVIESVEGIMKRPYGCGEQTISSTYPSLLLLRYYKQSGEQFPLQGRARNYLESGYSRLLNYRAEDGGFSYWARGEANVALTAYALRFLIDAAEIISVDQEVIDEAREWLVKQQQSNEHWNPLVKAYVARVLAMVETRLGGEAVKEKTATEVSSDDPYLLASYALALMDKKDASGAQVIIDKLRSLVRSEGDTNYWTIETTTPFHGWGLTGRVETTALVTQALIRSEANPKLINRALMFLLKYKDRYGVWHSTQATINVLDAMLALSSQNSATHSNSAAESTADIAIDGRVVHTIQLPAANRVANPLMVDISRFVKPGKNKLEITRRGGSGPYASVHALVNFYVPWSDSTAANKSKSQMNEAGGLRLLARFDKTESRINDEITCRVKAERVGTNRYGMMLAEIGLPPGASIDRSSLETAMNGSGWAISQYDVLPDRVVFYLWPQTGEVDFSFRFRPRFGLKAKTAPSVLYDYYNPEARDTVPPVTFTVR